MNSEHDPHGRLDMPPPKAVVARLSYYLRELQRMQREGHVTTNSQLLGQRLEFTDAQVRKDLSYFGLGYPGVGYHTEELVQAIQKILGTNQRWPVAIVGVGNLGRALLGYKGFSQQGFEIAAAFDIDPARVGTTVEGVPVYHLDRLPEIARQNKMRVAILAVPATAAQGVADKLVEAGIEGVLNFAPVTLTLPKGVSRVGVDLAIELEQLTFAVTSGLDKSTEKQG